MENKYNGSLAIDVTLKHILNNIISQFINYGKIVLAGIRITILYPDQGSDLGKLHVPRSEHLKT